MSNATAESLTEKDDIRGQRIEIHILLVSLIMPLMITLFFLQAVRVFIGQIYFQNLGAMSLGPTVLMVFFLLSPILILLLRGISLQRLWILTVLGVVVFRLLMPFLQTLSSFYLVSVSLSVAFFGMYLPVALSLNFEPPPSLPISNTSLFSIGFSLAFAVDISFRTIGVTWDLSTGPLGIVITPILCILTILFVYIAHPSFTGILLPEPTQSHELSRGRVAILGLGFGGVMFALLSLIAYPNVISRWTASSYLIATLSIAFAVFLYPMMLVDARGKQLLMRKEVILLLNLITLVTAVDLAYLLSHLSVVLAGVAMFTFMLDLYVMWNYLQSKHATLTDYTIFHFTGMLLLLLFTLFFVLTLVAGLLLPALTGLAPYLILASFVVAVLPSVILGSANKEVEA